MSNQSGSRPEAGIPVPDSIYGAAEVGPGIHVFTSGAYAMTSGAVMGARDCLLIDPGYFPSEIERIDAFVEARGSSVGRVLLTHSDWDHIVGAGRWPGAAIVASSAFPQRARSDGERIARALADFDRKMYVRRERAFIFPEPTTLAGSPSDIVWEGPRLHLVPAPGHTSDCLMTIAVDARLLFAGDYLSDREIPFVGDSLESYRETLSRVRGLVLADDIELLVPGHGDPCGRAGLLERIEEDLDYLNRLEEWTRGTFRSVKRLEGLLDRADEVVFRKGADNPDVLAEHRANVALLARRLGAI